MEEQWRPVIGYEGFYEVSNFGEVKRIKGGKGTSLGGVMKQQTGKRGRMKVSLCKNSESKTIDTARIVAEAFLGRRPLGLQINHIDYDCKNNRSDNLEYVTPSENIQHAYQNGFRGGIGERQGLSKLTEYDVRLIRRSPLSHSMLALHYNVATITIKCVRGGKTWKHVA